MTIQEMKQKKQEKGYSCAQIAELSGVPLSTVQKIFGGETENPRYGTIQALESLFREPQIIRREAAVYRTGGQPDMVREEAVAYCAQREPGSYTIEDYRALPDDRRVELIDGYFYDMAAPTLNHQAIAGEIYFQIYTYIREHGGSCMPFISPVDVQLDRDDHTMLQPDVIIVCNPDQRVTTHILGAPDFVLEVISPGTKRKDYTLKLTKYQRAGVREYWLVDPYQNVVIVYFFEDETRCPSIFPIDGNIPINIYEGKLVLDFRRVTEWAGRV